MAESGSYSVVGWLIRGLVPHALRFLAREVWLIGKRLGPFCVLFLQAVRRFNWPGVCTEIISCPSHSHPLLFSPTIYYSVHSFITPILQAFSENPIVFVIFTNHSWDTLSPCLLSFIKLWSMNHWLSWFGLTNFTGLLLISGFVIFALRMGCYLCLGSLWRKSHRFSAAAAQWADY